MKSLLQIKKHLPTRRTLLTSIIPTSVGLVLASVFAFVDCSSNNSVSSSASPIPVPISVNFQPSAVNLENSGDGLGLVDTGTSPIITITSCASGYTSANHTVLSGTVSLYNGDQNCLVILHSFVFQSNTYNDTNNGALAFALSGEPSDATGAVATFSDVGSGATAANLIKVFIGTQVSSPVSVSSTIVFNFTDISAGATDNVTQSSVATAVPLTVNGRTAPNYYDAGSETNGGILYSRYLSTNSNGTGNMSFTIACGLSVTGSGGNYSCPQPVVGGDTVQTTDVQHTEINYILVPDETYGACATTGSVALTVANANAIFASGTSLGSGVQTIPASNSSTSGGGLTSAGSGQIAAGIADNYANVIANGGFDTPSVLTGINPIYSNTGLGSPSWSYTNDSNLYDLLILERLDSSGNALSYLYSCVDLAAITQD